MGVTRGKDFTPKPRAAREAGIEALLDGQIRDTAHGAFYEVSHAYPANTARGPAALADWLGLDTGVLASIGSLDGNLPADLRRFAFLDTETTGLGGAGAVAFMVGVGLFNDASEFEVHQYFLRDPSEEAALLAYLNQLISDGDALVTFNGRTFDVPLLSGRYILARQKTHLTGLPNLDLLAPARRLWQRRLPSCALSALEGDILRIQRSHADVPGSMIPYLYTQYLQTGDASEMARVFYHNEQDILSMVVLAVILARHFCQPDVPNLPIEDRLSLARWYDHKDMIAKAEAAYRLALDEAPDAETRHAALTYYAAMLKRLDRRHEARPLWEDLADLKLDISGYEELAKFYEWHEVEITYAVRWTEQGITLAESWRPGIRRVEALTALSHRLARLQRKLNGASDGEFPEAD